MFSPTYESDARMVSFIISDGTHKTLPLSSINTYQRLTDTLHHLYPDCDSNLEVKTLTKDSTPGARIHPRFWPRVVSSPSRIFYIELHPAANNGSSGAQIQLDIHLEPPENVFDRVVPRRLALSVSAEMMLGQVAEEVKDMLTAHWGPRTPFAVMLMWPPRRDLLCSLAGLGIVNGDRVAYWIVPGHSAA